MSEQRGENLWERFHRDSPSRRQSRRNRSHRFRGTQPKKQVFATSLDLHQRESGELSLKLGRDGPTEPAVAHHDIANSGTEEDRFEAAADGFYFR